MRIIETVTWLCLLCLAVTNANERRAEQPPAVHLVVKTAEGPVRGRLAKSAQGVNVEEYLGIPFAQPPIGDLRYADPEPAKHWTAILPTTEHGPSCHQPLDLTFGKFPGSDMWNAPNRMDEDCLYLNVWTPHPRPEQATVLVWIYGGGFYSGTSALEVYDGKTLAGHSNLIVVSMNYRVGSLGFLATGDGRIKGNFGLKDQLLALQWVQRNIKKFGGNPDSVTIMGESAGAASVGFHLMSPHSQHLFKRGIMQSGSPDAHWAFMSAEQAKDRSDKFFTAIKCDDDEKVLQCLRKSTLTAKHIVNNEWVDGHFLVFPWAPTCDGSFLLDTPANLISKKQFKKTDLLLGANKDEGTFWILYAVPTYSKDTSSVQTWQQLLAAVDITEYDLDDSVKQAMLELYTKHKNHLNEAANRNVLDNIVGDRSFLCPTIEFANANVKSRQNTYVYRLEQRASNEVWPGWMGVIHGADIQYVFGVPLNKSLGHSDDDVKLSEEIMSYWANFARYGRPNGLGNKQNLHSWPKYNIYEAYQDFLPGSKTETKAAMRAKFCDFWDVVNKVPRGKN